MYVCCPAHKHDWSKEFIEDCRQAVHRKEVSDRPNGRVAGPQQRHASQQTAHFETVQSAWPASIATQHAHWACIPQIRMPDAPAKLGHTILAMQGPAVRDSAHTSPPQFSLVGGGYTHQPNTIGTRNRSPHESCCTSCSHTRQQHTWAREISGHMLPAPTHQRGFTLATHPRAQR